MGNSTKRIAIILGICCLTLISVISSGFAEEPIVLGIDLESIQSLFSVTHQVTALDSAGRESSYTVTGVLLDTFLQDMGYKQADLTGLRLTAVDGYAIDVPQEVLQNREIILGYAIDGQLLDQRSAPIRVIIPEERAMYWVKRLHEITILGYEPSSNVETIVFLDTLQEHLPSSEVAYYEDNQRGIAVGDLFEHAGIDQPHPVFYLQAADGLTKTEAVDVFLSGFLLVSGSHHPLFMSPDIPRGMHVKDLLYFVNGRYGVISLHQAQSVMDLTIQGETEGVLITEVFELLGLRSAERYHFYADDGYLVEVTASDLENSIVYFDDNKRIRTLFPGLPKNTSVRGLLKVEVVD